MQGRSPKKGLTFPSFHPSTDSEHAGKIKNQKHGCLDAHFGWIIAQTVWWQLGLGHGHLKGGPPDAMSAQPADAYSQH